MMRWILLIAAVAAVFWLYEKHSANGGPPKWQQAGTPSATLPPGGRLGGGLNPFVTDGDPDAPPQQPRGRSSYGPPL